MNSEILIILLNENIVLSDVALTRKGKLSLESTIKYPLCNNRKTTSIDINHFF